MTEMFQYCIWHSLIDPFRAWGEARVENATWMFWSSGVLGELYHVMKSTERVLWGVSLVCVLVWGVKRGGAPDVRTATAGGEHAVVRELGGGSAASDPRREARGSRRSGRHAEDLAAWESRVAGSLGQADPLQRMAGFLKLLAACDGESIGHVAAGWEKLKATGVSLPAEEALLNYRLGQLQGGEVLAGHTGSAEDFASLDLLKRRFEGWLQSDSYSAGTWLDALPAGKFRDQIALSAIAASGSYDSDGALTRVAQLPEHLRQAAGKTMGERIRETGSIESGSELLRELGSRAGEGDTAYLKGIFQSLLGGSAGPSGEMAARLVEDHLDQPYVDSAALAQVSTGKGKADPVSALEWAMSMEERKPDLPQGSLLAAAVQGMNLADLQAAEDWALDQAGSPGIAEMQADLEVRRRVLEDRGDDENEYDKDD